MRIRAVIGTIISLVGACACLAQQPRYRATDIGTLGGLNATPAAINDYDQITGYSNTASYMYTDAFLWDRGSMIDLGNLYGGDMSRGLGLNSLGEVVGFGQALHNNQSVSYAFEYANGQMTDLGGGYQTEDADGINDAGQVVGAVYLPGHSFATAATWIHGVQTLLGGFVGSTESSAAGINSKGQIIGYSDSPNFLDACIWYNGGLTDLGSLGGPIHQSYGTAINSNGEAVGWALNANVIERGFYWNGGAMQELSALQSQFESHAYAINDAGTIVGDSQNGADFYAVVWNAGQIQDLNLVSDIESGQTLISAQGVNNRGHILATGRTSSGQYVYRAILLVPYFTVDPASYSIVRGQYVSGSLSSLFNADGSYLVARTTAARRRSDVGVTIVLTGTSSEATPSDVRLILKSHVNSSNLGQTVEMYDYQSNAWVVVDSTTATLSDSVETAIATNPGRFVQSGTKAMMARLSWKPTGQTDVFPWSVFVDQAVWNVSP